MKRKHPDAALTLPEAFEKHYHKAELATTTLAKFRYTLNAWEQTVGKVPVGKIDNAVLMKFRDDFHKLGRSARTVNDYWYTARTILRLLGPQADHCPQGLGIIDKVPYVRPLKCTCGLPRRVSIDDLSRAYVACNVAQFPKGAGYPPAEFWRLMIVVALFTALRKADLFSIRLRDIDPEAGTLTTVARKTAKPMNFPLHPIALEHIKRLWSDREFLLPQSSFNGGNFSRRWREIVKHAGVDAFTLHDIRRTAASEVERVKPGMGGILLQHRMSDVTSHHYLNQVEELREAILAMRVPLAFKHGPKQVDREAGRMKLEREKFMQAATFTPPNKPDAADWSFRHPAEPTGRFAEVWFRGRRFVIGAQQCVILERLATSTGPVSLDALISIVFRGRPIPSDNEAKSGRVCAAVSELRRKLRVVFGLSERWNPVPCERIDGGRWSLLLPVEASAARRDVQEFVTIPRSEYDRLLRAAEPKLTDIVAAARRTAPRTIAAASSLWTRDLRAKRKSLRLSVATAARIAGVNRQTLFDIESGSASPRVVTIQKIVAAFQAIEASRQGGAA